MRRFSASALDIRWFIVSAIPAQVIWDGTEPSEINSAEAGPLVGMDLLDGYEIRIQAVIGGSVTIQSLVD